MSKGKQSYRILDGTTLKIIAMISMIIDHVGDNFFPEQTWMRIVGRIAFPIFAFCIAEGFSHTHDRRKYLLRMGIFACISEIPFDLVTSGKILEFTHQNIMITFFWAILGLMCFEKINGRKTKTARFCGIAVLMIFAVSSLLLGMDYNILAVGLICIYYFLRDKAPVWNHVAAMVYHVLLRNVGVYLYGLLGFLPLFLYNGKRGRGLKWLFYIFYPAHLLVIWLLKMF
ncbi:MAG: hypothetical protein IIZ27_10475 [Solobacterium sp.]|nr:hypothetical protein [Solobacterium sp.]MBR2668394.1 hypothetical protein [Solobacterium sp.]